MQTDPPERANGKFFIAMKAAANHAVAERSCEPMLAHLSGCSFLNKTGVLGALKLMSAPRRVNKADRDAIIVAMLRALSRHGQAALDLHKDVLDAALCN